MKNSNLNFVFSCMAFGFFLTNSCGLSRKISVSNHLLTIQYSDSSKTHSRAITSIDNKLFIAESDGKVYQYPKQTDEKFVFLNTPNKEYRDIIVHQKTIIALAVGVSSEVNSLHLKHKKKRNKTPFNGIFLDGMDSFGSTLFLMGDPVAGQFSLFTSKDWGESWKVIKNSPLAYNGEAGFAASGTNVKVENDSTLVFVTGGYSSRFFRSTDLGETWYFQSMGFNSCATCGAYSLTIQKDGRIIAVGGDYFKPEETNGTCRISADGGKNWFAPKTNPNGYRSNITEINNVLYTCGTNGIDFSKDNGETWTSFAKGNYFTLCEFDKKLAASSTNGTIQLFKLIE